VGAFMVPRVAPGTLLLYQLESPTQANIFTLEFFDPLLGGAGTDDDTEEADAAWLPQAIELFAPAKPLAHR